MTSSRFRSRARALLCLSADDARAQRAAVGCGSAGIAARGAPIDLTGQWVAIISEDWRWRMITPAKGDIVSIPLNLQGQQVAEAWDPAKDEAAGEQCKAYGAPGLMRGPIRMRISWADDNTLKLDTDYGMQTRCCSSLRQPRTAARAAGRARRRRNGSSAAAAAAASATASLKTVTTNLRPATCARTASPIASARCSRILGRARAAQRRQIPVNTNVVEDPVYLQLPFQTAIHYKLERDTAKWDPTPCDARF
jgi:hypothetical protein